jgi:hypothetical protein
VGDHDENVVIPLTPHQARDFIRRVVRAMGGNGSNDDEHDLLVEITDDVAVAVGEADWGDEIEDERT